MTVEKYKLTDFGNVPIDLDAYVCAPDRHGYGFEICRVREIISPVKRYGSRYGYKLRLQPLANESKLLSHADPDDVIVMPGSQITANLIMSAGLCSSRDVSFQLSQTTDFFGREVEIGSYVLSPSLSSTEILLYKVKSMTNDITDCGKFKYKMLYLSNPIKPHRKTHYRNSKCVIVVPESQRDYYAPNIWGGL